MATDEPPEPGNPTPTADGPVVLDGIVSSEKLGELRALEAEYPGLDFKATLDPSNTGDLVELAKDVGAMQVRGGYIVVGVDGRGAPTGDLNSVDHALFDEARLAPKLRKYLPDPLELCTNVLTVGDHTIALIYVGRHPSGCAFFKADGTYLKDGKEKVAFRRGDAFWRDGTSSVRLTQQGFEEIVARRIRDEKDAWVVEQQTIRQRDQAELEQSFRSRRLADGPLGAISFEHSPHELNGTALELLRAGDEIGLRHLFADGLTRARTAIESGDLDTGLSDILDRFVCLAATFLAYEQLEWFRRSVDALLSIYSMPVREHDGRRFGYSTWINPAEKAPRVWLLVVERVFALGSVAVHKQDWNAVRLLATQRPERVTDYETTWLRHALTMAARAQHLETKDDQQTVKLSLLSLARSQAARLDCLRPDGVDPDADEIITALARFDVLANLAAIDAAGAVEARAFYPNFARFRQDRIQPAVDELLTNAQMRQVLFRGTDAQLARALFEVGRIASHEGWMSDGFVGWDRTRAGAFIAEHLPNPEQ